MFSTDSWVEGNRIRLHHQFLRFFNVQATGRLMLTKGPFGLSRSFANASNLLKIFVTDLLECRWCQAQRGGCDIQPHCDRWLSSVPKRRVSKTTRIVVRLPLRPISASLEWRSESVYFEFLRCGLLQDEAPSLISLSASACDWPGGSDRSLCPEQQIAGRLCPVSGLSIADLIFLECQVHLAIG